MTINLYPAGAVRTGRPGDTAANRRRQAKRTS
ncbi:hypothetical protein predicted by Glimmer/Critica [Azoarcus olearius]|uniref:Uncharacterized protein n=1 Tax=Azoarcus sp. (strain BH72) TaxID=418699 RepID=A1KCJ4_AZOSB|nr:hypothetical protein predicted by Glimmer/Critica [Azoarcus olearius]